MADPLASVPSGSKYNNLRFMLQVLKRDFPDKYKSLSEGRISGWVQEIDSGTGRDADQIRDDIVKYVIGKQDAMERYDIDENQYEQLIIGGNEGGINFGDLEPADLDDPNRTKEGVPDEEDIEEEGVGADDGDPDTPDLTILKGKDMKWYFDKTSGKWYVEYGLPNSDRTIFFEASPDQMDSLFGENRRPINYENRTLRYLTNRSGSTYSGNIAEMEGTGSFEDEVQRVITLGLDEGRLPEWAKGDQSIMDILYIAEAEGKSSDWMLQEISKTNTFKTRFPNIEKFREQANLSLGEAVTGFLEMESGVRHALNAAGLPDAVDPKLVGDLLENGYSLSTINDTVKTWKRAKEYKPALDSFNRVLEANGFETISSIQEMMDFVSGQAPAAMYDLWEQSSIAEAAEAAGLGDLFTVEDAIELSYSTNQTLESATAGMQKAAELLLRLRHEVDTQKYGLDHEELIDISLGQTPRSGRPQSEIMENVNRAVLSAQKSLQSKSSAFTSFSQEGTPQAASLRRLRQQS